jgi:TrmH family RNA methyltransferase
VVADALWAGISALESPARMGFVLDLPRRRA